RRPACAAILRLLPRAFAFARAGASAWPMAAPLIGSRAPLLRRCNLGHAWLSCLGTWRPAISVGPGRLLLLDLADRGRARAADLRHHLWRRVGLGPTRAG